MSEEDWNSHLNDVDRAKLKNDPAAMAAAEEEYRKVSQNTYEMTHKTYSWEKPVHRRDDDNHPPNVSYDELRRIIRGGWRPPAQEQTTPKHARRSTDGTGKPMIDLTPAAERRTGGVGMASAEELAAAVAQVKSDMENHLGGALINARTVAEEIQAQISRLDGGMNSASLMNAIRYLESIRDSLSTGQQILQATAEVLDGFVAGIGNI